MKNNLSNHNIIDFGYEKQKRLNKNVQNVSNNRAESILGIIQSRQASTDNRWSKMDSQAQSEKLKQMLKSLGVDI